ncbi:MerR family transcriptional regulator [Falsigemmobacter faecalis]|uniref:MerR family transcriptional regulator n=1 Tax=Falsigemmobacter faecalis TaxID=2488730 RepID=A0A3P3DDQ4_9RHOB|nr:MerR family transcriptional regulator [Falsigemmobacter faecalis]RRH71974.1 MerR family transcriptional regulator [Falsigemmobacter faecalis]
MNHLKQKIRFTAAANAAGVAPKTLRNWMDRYPLQLVADYGADGWTEFTVFDVGIIALMKQLTDFGVPVTRANEIAFKTLMGVAHALLGYQNTPVAAFVAIFRGRTKFVWKDGSTYQDKSVYRPKSADDLPHAVSMLVIDLEELIETAIGKLTSVGEVGE